MLNICLSANVKTLLLNSFRPKVILHKRSKVLGNEHMHYLIQDNLSQTLFLLERSRFPWNIDIPWNIVEYGGILWNIAEYCGISELIGCLKNMI